MGIGMGPRIHEVCPFGAVNHSYAATGSSALETAIAAAYKQVFGNIGISDSQRLTSLEAFLCDGRINVQGFMGGLVKSDLYKQKFFHAVSPMRGIELTTKHLLGRPPVSQQEISAGIQLIADQGFDAFVDSLTHSEEYLETFGTDTVPYLRGFKSEARAACSTFVGMADLTPANASAEHVMYTGPLLVKRLTKDLSTFAAGGGAFSGDGAGFSYTNAVKNSRNSAYRRMYGGKFNYGSY
jgi:phycocyanin-associated rod linker protein